MFIKTSLVWFRTRQRAMEQTLQKVFAKIQFCWVRNRQVYIRRNVWWMWNLYRVIGFVDDGYASSKSRLAPSAVLNTIESEFKITIEDGSSFIGQQIKRDHKYKLICVHSRKYLREWNYRQIFKIRNISLELRIASSDPNVHLKLPEPMKRVTVKCRICEGSGIPRILSFSVAPGHCACGECLRQIHE